jgi:hypothetical protein
MNFSTEKLRSNRELIFLLSLKPNSNRKLSLEECMKESHIKEWDVNKNRNYFKCGNSLLRLQKILMPPRKLFYL